MHWTKRPAQIAQTGFPLIERRPFLAALVPPDVAMNTTGVAALSHQKSNRSRPAERRQTTAGNCAQAIIQAFVKPPAVKVRRLHAHLARCDRASLARYSASRAQR